MSVVGCRKQGMETSMVLHTENGQSVLVLAQGAGPWVSGVAWKTPQLAQQYKHKKFKDLYYQDDQ